MAPREVRCRLELQVTQPARLAFQVEVARVPGLVVTDRLDISVDGVPVAASTIEPVSVVGAGTIQLVDAPMGLMTLAYEARVVADPAAGPPTGPAFSPADLLAYLRPSRYCPSDALVGFAAAEFGAVSGPVDQARAVVDWVAGRLAYVPGSSGPLDTAVHTLLASEGVCRDYAHLVVALCRALNVPARLVAVYAPGLAPMDFHAVAEAHLDGAWRVLDATRLAPRQSLVRLATGRDAADTAFLSTVSGTVDFRGAEVWAVVDGALPADDHTDLVTLA